MRTKGPDIVDLYSTLQVEMDYPAALLILISDTIKSMSYCLKRGYISKDRSYLSDRNRPNNKGGREKSLKTANKFMSEDERGVK